MEVYSADSTASAINNVLKTKNLRVRLGINNVSSDNKNFSSTACFPSFKNCVAEKIDLDKVAQTFKSNGWSMIPMLSYGYHGMEEPFASSDIDKYVNFVDWFVSRYKNDANIKYVELENCPGCVFSLPISKELLLETTNKIYNKIKGKYPDIMMGTPGFEYWVDEQNSKFVDMIEYFLNRENGAKFDFWAFHGYPLSELKGRIKFVPPTKTAVYNNYAGIKGVTEIRKKLDANGWQNRLIIDTESGTINPGNPDTDVDAAYQTQEALLMRVQKINGKLVNAWGDMTAIISAGNSIGQATRPVKALALLWSKLNEYEYSSRISGEFNDENQAWVEKFTSGSKELYIFFKPFEYGESLGFDNKTIDYTLNLSKQPSSVKLTLIDGTTQNLTSAQSIVLKAENSLKFLEVEH